MQEFEKLGVFYLGREFDPDAGRPTENLLLYDSKDLVTHGVCVGMTGSGKTGLCISLLEEAAIDGIPAIVLDPKGDLGNLLLTFPGLRAADFRPWIDEGEAARQSLSPDEYAAKVSDEWKKGLADWGEGPERIQRFRESVDAVIYTPGSNAGIPLAVLRSLEPPKDQGGLDADASRERVIGTASSLLVLLGIEADPVRSREHILVSKILEHSWSAGRALDLGELIRQIQSPPFDRFGVLDLESFYPGRERSELAVRLNNLLASPGFAAWMEGDPLDVARLLWSPEGKPQLSIVSIAHLSDAERMFFVTLLLNEIVAWMRTQSGTGSLRAILYMDEVFGYLPPVANPPSKVPLLTLLKQARAFGLGVLVATQNPVDLDYKALSNAGTWLLGRLQTERDKARVLDGLLGAAAGATLDRQRLDAILGGLARRTFLMHDVHEKGPVVFQTRHTLSYLGGPLTRAQIQRLTAARRETQRGAMAGARSIPPNSSPPVAAAPDRDRPPQQEMERPVLPQSVREVFLSRDARSSGGARVAYRPALLASCRLHYVDAKAAVDHWERVFLLAPLAGNVSDDPWEHAEDRGSQGPAIEKEPIVGASFDAIPAAASRAESYERWSKLLEESLYRSRTFLLLRHRGLGLVSTPGESKGDFLVRARQVAREKRDEAVETLRRRYAPKIAALEEQKRRAEDRVKREQTQFQQQSVQTAISLGATILGAVFGRKVASTGNLGRATTTVRGAGRAMREREEIGMAEENKAAIEGKITELSAAVEKEAAEIRGTDVEASEVEEVPIRPRKSDISIEDVALTWTP